MATSSKTGKKKVPEQKRVPAILDAERQRQLEEIRLKNGGSRNAAIAYCISLAHGHLKRDWPDDFS